MRVKKYAVWDGFSIPPNVISSEKFAPTDNVYTSDAMIEAFCVILCDIGLMY